MVKIFLLLSGIFLVCGVLMRPVGRYFWNVLMRQRTLLDGFLDPIATTIYQICHIPVHHDQKWGEYLSSMLIFNGCGFVFLFLLFQTQHFFENQCPVTDVPCWLIHLNLAMSYVSNTNWQPFAPEQTLSTFSLMVGVGTQYFLSAASGIAVAIAFVRSFKTNQQILYDQTHPDDIPTQKYHERYLGNFWVDIVRITLWFLLPCAVFVGCIYVILGVPQGWGTLPGLNPLTLGPIASLESIKILGSNGGGYFEANSAHPFENPSSATHFLQMVSMIFIPMVLFEVFGRKITDSRHAYTLLISLFCILIFSVVVSGWISGHADIWGAYEARLGAHGSLLFSILTNSSGCGATCMDHSTLHPVVQLILVCKMMLGAIDFGSVGSGFCLLISYVILTVFLTGLMVGRTPEYLGKKIEAPEIRMIVLIILLTPLSILGLSACLCYLSPTGDIRSFSRIVYMLISTTSNNGSALGESGIYTTQAALWITNIAMLMGRYGVLSAVLCIAGSFSKKMKIPRSNATLPTRGLLFASLLIGTILICNGLIYFPVLCLSFIPDVLSIAVVE